MEVSTTPARWKDFQSRKKEDERNTRATKTNVTRLDYLDSGKTEKTDCKTLAALTEALRETTQAENHDKVQLRLFVVEDLSRDVIEILGARFDVEPAFFREHIVDYAWYNTRDPWVDPPNLDAAATRQRWFQLRFPRARYFKTTESFKNGRAEAESFNVLRRPDDDQNNKAWWDEDGAIVGITRTRASFWLRHGEGQEKEAVGKCCYIQDGSRYGDGIASNWALVLTCGLNQASCYLTQQSAKGPHYGEVIAIGNPPPV